MTRLVAAPAVMLLALALLGGGAASGSTASPGATPGVSARSILIGSTGSLTGESAAAAGVLRGAEAYFKYVNARGGVNGRKITLRYYDDAGDPALAEENARRLIEDDQVLALFSTVGTAATLAVRPLASASRVPHLFAASAADTLGRDRRQYPYTLGYPPAHAGEGHAYARYLLTTAARRSKIAVLYEDDEDGAEVLAGLEKGLGASRTKIVATLAHDPAAVDVQQEVAELKASGANTLMVLGLGRAALDAGRAASRLGWRPRLYVSSESAAPAAMRLVPQALAEGSISVAFAKDPDSPAFAGDGAVELASTLVRRYLPGQSARDGALVAGMASAFTMVDALRRAGKTPTRESLLRAATGLNEANNPFLLPGIVVRTSAVGRAPITQLKLRRWHSGHWQPLGGLVSAQS